MATMAPQIVMAVVAAAGAAKASSDAKSASNASNARAQQAADRERRNLKLKTIGEENIARADLARRKAAMRAKHAAGGLSTGGSAEAVQMGLTKQSNRDMYQKRLATGIGYQDIKKSLDETKYKNLLEVDAVENKNSKNFFNTTGNISTSLLEQ